MDVALLYIILIPIVLKFKVNFKLFFIPIILFIVSNILAPYYNFQLSSADFAHFDYTIWNASNLRGLDLSIGEDSLYYRNLLGNHFSPILFIISLPQYLFSSHLYLPILSILLFLFSLFLMYIISNFHLKDRLLSAIFSVSFLCSKYFSKVINYEFHHEIIYIPLLLLLYLGYINRFKSRSYILSMLLVAIISVKEDSWLIISGIFLYLGSISTKNSHRFAFLILIPICAFSLLLTLQFIMPLFHKEGFSPNSSTFLSLWSSYGDNAQSAFVGMLKRPHSVLFDLLTNKTFYYLFVPLLFLPFATSSFLIFTPSILIHLLSSYPLMKNLLIYYSAPFLALIFIAALISLEKFKNRRNIILIISFLLLGFNIGNFRFRSFNPFNSQNASLQKLNSKVNKLDGNIYILGTLITRINYDLKIRRFTNLKQLKDANYLVLTRPGNYHPFSKNDIDSLIDSNKTKVIYKDDFNLILKL